MTRLHSTVVIGFILICLPILGGECVRKRQWFNRWSLKQWWVIFLGASIVDVGSTYFLILIRAMPWTIEHNWLLSYVGPLIGYSNAMLWWNLIIVVTLYAIACMTHPPPRYKSFVWFMCVASGVRFWAAICNMTLVW